MGTRTEKKRSMWLVSLKAALAASALSVALVAAFAFVLQKQWLGIGSITYINTGVKVVSAVLAAFIAARAAETRAPLWGALAAGGYMLVTFIVFSLLSMSFSPSLGLLTDLAMCVLAGAVTGILLNLRK